LGIANYALAVVHSVKAFARMLRVLSMTLTDFFYKNSVQTPLAISYPLPVSSRAIRKFVVCEDTNDGIKIGKKFWRNIQMLSLGA